MMATNRSLMTTPMALADMARFLADLFVYAIALLPAGWAFLALWRTSLVWAQVLAFPAAYLAFIAGFYLALMLLILVFCRKIESGRYRLADRAALRWVLADSVVRLLERSFFRGYVKDFSLQRRIFYRALGARIKGDFMMGWEVRILDPWATEIGSNALIGSFSVISGHSVEGDSVEIAPVKIGEGAVVGMRSVLLPGVEVGPGAIVGAGAVVTKGATIPPGEIWAGVPARKIGETQEAKGEGGSR